MQYSASSTLCTTRTYPDLMCTPQAPRQENSTHNDSSCIKAYNPCKGSNRKTEEGQQCIHFSTANEYIDPWKRGSVRFS